MVVNSVVTAVTGVVTKAMHRDRAGRAGQHIYFKERGLWLYSTVEVGVCGALGSCLSTTRP